MPPCRGDCKRVAREQRRGGTLTVDVNSRERAERMRAEIAARLGERARYERAVIQSMESLRTQGADPDREEEAHRLESLPEVQELPRCGVNSAWTELAPDLSSRAGTAHGCDIARMARSCEEREAAAVVRVSRLPSRVCPFPAEAGR